MIQTLLTDTATPPINILLIDDPPENLLALESMLGDMGHTLVKAQSGTEALKCLLREDFALILLDVQMPGLDGFETAELIHGRERSRNTPIIFLTALDRSEAGLYRGYSVGAVDFLFKPLVPEVLRSKVAVFVDLFRKTQQIQQQAVVLEQRVQERTAALLDANAALRAEIAERERAEARLHFLSDATTLLSASLEYEQTLQQLTALVVPTLATWATVSMLNSNDTLRQVAVHHADPAKLELVWQFDQRNPARSSDGVGPGRVLRTGEPEIIPAVSDALLAAAAQDDEHLKFLRSLRITSLLALPLRGRSRIVGVLQLALAEDGRFYTPTDIELATELAHRTALAVENALFYREAQQALQIRDDFLSIAAHELKTPITAITGHLQLMQRRAERNNSLSERDQRALRTLNEQTLRLNRLIHTVLDISRLQIGQLAIEHAPLNLQALVQQVVETTAATAERHQSALHIPDHAVTVVGDEVRLEQVLQNLIQNAIKYSPEGGPIEITLAEQPDAVTLTVTDHGIGIPDGALEHLFACFYRAANVAGTHISGMGVGLYVVKEIVALHGGSIDVRSAENQGSTFALSLPKQPADATP